MELRKISILVLSLLMTLVFNLQSSVLASTVTVDHQTRKLKGYLKENHQAHIFTFTNNSNNEIKIYNVDFAGDQSLEQAMIEANDQDKKALTVLWAFGIGLFWLFLLPTAIALIATPFVLIKRGMTRKKTRQEEWEFTEKSPREVTIKAGETEDLVAIFPKEIMYTRLSFSTRNIQTGVVSNYEEKYTLKKLQS
jgi:hypothetical protein